METIENLQLYSSAHHFIDMREIDDDSIIVDAGACWGGFIECLREHERGKNCRVIAVECDKDNIKKLKERNYRNTTICDKALVGQDFDDRSVFYQIIGYAQWGNFYKKTPGDPTGINEIKEYEVEVLRINDIFSVFDIEWIDFLKMDIEGLERDILKTMTEETAVKIGQVSIEVHDWDGFPSVSDVIEMLGDLGFNAFTPDKTRKEVFGKRERRKNDE